jgi:hypothetical protein
VESICILTNSPICHGTTVTAKKNPVKSGLVLKAEDYRYSSARNYAFNDHSVLEVNTELGGIDLYTNK